MRFRTIRIVDACESSLRSALAAYGRRVVRIFGEGRLDTLAGAGVALPFASRQALHLQFTTRDNCAVEPPLAHEAELFEKWCQAKTRPPLLIEGPFGSGKSGLLTAFAVTLASRLAGSSLPGGAALVP